MLLRELTNIIAPVLQSHNVIKASIFGSYAKGLENSNSDIDILVELQKDKSLLDLISLEFDLQALIERKIDLITYDSINLKLKEEILSSQILIYEQK
jgi:hypothetical protein